MKAINIYTYSRIQENMATEFENILSQRSKKLNRFTKKIKDKLSELNNAITISETVDIINDELMGAELKKKVVRNGLKLLQLICGKACAGSSIG